MNLVSRMARRVLPSRLALMGAASAGTLGLVGLVALAGAAIPSGDGKINGCYGKFNGYLRVIDTAKESCQKLEIPISWNQAGSPGPEGPTGPTGPQGTGGTGGAITSLDALDGIDCTRVDGAPGVLSISHGQGSSILFDCGPISTCGDDTYGDLPSQAHPLGSVSGDNPNQAGLVSANGMMCPGDVDYFTASITESQAATMDLEGLIRLQMQPGVPLMLTTSILSATGEVESANANNPDVWTLDLNVTVTDSPEDNVVILQIKVEGVLPHITGPYTLSVYGALE